MPKAFSVPARMGVGPLRGDPGVRLHVQSDRPVGGEAQADAELDRRGRLVDRAGDAQVAAPGHLRRIVRPGLRDRDGDRRRGNVRVRRLRLLAAAAVGGAGSVGAGAAGREEERPADEEEHQGAWLRRPRGGRRARWRGAPPATPRSPPPPDEHPRKVEPASLYWPSGALHQPFAKLHPGS